MILQFGVEGKTWENHQGNYIQILAVIYKLCYRKLLSTLCSFELPDTKLAYLYNCCTFPTKMFEKRMYSDKCLQGHERIICAGCQFIYFYFLWNSSNIECQNVEDIMVATEYMTIFYNEPAKCFYDFEMFFSNVWISMFIIAKLS